MRIPQWNLSVRNRLDDEVLPRIVFEDQIADQLVLRNLRVELLCRGFPWLPLIKIVGRQQRLAAQRHRPEQQQRQQKQYGQDEKVSATTSEHGD